jgi:ankyrin repeat protein
VQYLIEIGSDVNIQDVRGRSPLHLAILNNDIDLANLLIGSGANIELKDNNGNTPLLNAVRFAKFSTIEYLINNRADILATNSRSSGIIHLCVKTNEILKLKKLLNLKIKVDIDLKNSVGNTALHQAAYLGFEDISKELMKNGAKTEIRNDRGNTALHRASHEGKYRIILSLLANKALINARNNDGNTPLHRAVYSHNHNSVVALIKNKANIEALNNQGLRAQDLAVSPKIKDIFEKLSFASAANIFHES